MTLATPHKQVSTTRLIQITIVVLLCFFLGWAGGKAVTNWSTISRIWYEAAEIRYLTLAGELGPVTYLVTHSGYEKLQNTAMAMEGVLGVEVHRVPDIATIGFASADVDAIRLLRENSVVSSMRRAFIPMFCH